MQARVRYFLITLLMFLLSYNAYASQNLSQAALLSLNIQPNICIPSVSITFHGDGLTGINKFTCPFITYYSPLTGGGYGPIISATLPQLGLNQYNSPAAAVAAYNEQNAAWLGTCPQTPQTNPTTDSYFVNGAAPFVGGDACRSPHLTLLSDIVYTNEYSWSLFHLAEGSSNVSATNLGSISLKDVAYSPQLDSGVISTAYDTNTNIFSGVPPGPQQGIWEWFVNFANLANVNPHTETTSANFGGIPIPSVFGLGGSSKGYIPYIAFGIGYTPPYEVYPIACIYLYGYTESITLQSIQNANVPYIYQTTPGKNATFDTPLLPSILYNFQVNNPSLGSNLYTLDQLSYAAISPYNYYNPQTSEFPISISTPGLFFASYNNNKKQQACNSGGQGFFGGIGCIWGGFTGSLNSNTVLIPYAMNGLTFNSMDGQTIAYPDLGLSQLYNYGASATQLATAGQNTTNALLSIRSPLSLAAIPQDYVFALANTILVPTRQSASVASCSASSTASNLDSFIKSTISNLGVPDTQNNEALLAAIANSYGTGDGFQYNNPLAVTNQPAFSIPPSGGGPSISGNNNIPPPKCTASDGTPLYDDQGTGESATTAVFQQSVTVNGNTITVYSSIISAMQNNEPLSYYTTNAEVANALTTFEITQSTPSDILGTITSAISSNGGSGGAATYFVNWATALTVSSNPPAQTFSLAGSTNSIYVMRTINQGYYNGSLEAPDTFPSVQDSAKTSDTSLFTSPPQPASSICTTSPTCQQVWEANWNNYWTSLIRLEGTNTYVIQQIPLSPSIIGVIAGGGSVGGLCVRHPNLCPPPKHCKGGTICVQPAVPPEGSSIHAPILNPPCHVSIANPYCSGTSTPSFTPMNISADASGDVYVSGTIAINGIASPWIIKITDASGGVSSITGSLIELKNGKIPQDSNGQQLTPTEIAVSPDGKLLFVTSQHSSDIFVLSGETLGYIGTYSLVYSSDVTPLGITYQGASSYNPVKTPFTPVPELNITDYFQSGSLYGINTTNNGALNSIISAFKKAGITQLDEPQYHHPMAMQDVNGYLYVLDNWYGGIGSQCNININFFGKVFCYTHTNTANFDTLMLRVINSTGQDVPINPSTYDDVWFQTGTNSYQRYTGIQSNAYPPFGWMLSASISNGKGGSLITVCGIGSQGCQTPTISYITSHKSNYWPLGPSFNGLTCSNSIWVTILGGRYDCAFLPLAGMGFSVSFNNTVSILFPSPQNINSGSTKTANNYGELIFSRFNLENYTQSLGPKGPPILEQSSCYADVNGDHIITSYITNPNLCVLDPSVNSFESPILLLSSPFNYTENIGSLKTLTYSEYLYSTFSGAGSITSSSSSNYNTIENSYLTNVNTPGFINSGETLNAGNGGNSLAYVSSQQTQLASTLSGYALVPYQEVFKQEQKITQSKLYIFPSIASEYWCFTNPLTLPPYSISRTWDTVTNVITYGSTGTSVSSLTEPIEGGPSYAKYLFNSTLYQQVLNTTIIPKDLLLDLLTNRIFGSVYANYTISSLLNAQVIINATRLYDYWITHYTQGIGLHPYYEAIYPKSVSQCYGPTCIFNPFSLLPSNIKNKFTYTKALVFPNAVTLFNFYQDMLFANYTFLNFTASGGSLVSNPYGYHRIVLVFNDRFNNNIYLPIDADVANITSIGLQVTPTVSSSNANQTTLTISGNLNYTPLFTTQQIPLDNGKVYLYYDANLGFLDYNPLTDQKDVQLCAFGFGPSVPQDCQLANPNWLYLKNGVPTPSLNAQIVTYNPSYGSSGACQSPPNSLLQPFTYNCNIYGTDGKTSIPTTCLPNSNGNEQYCSQIFANGTGLCTSQLGLIGTATTDANGHFTYQTTACGYGYSKIIAAFYGEPSPQPLIATQSPIEYAYNPSYSGTNDKFNATDYSWAPTSTSGSTAIGALFLNYGEISYLYILSAIVIVSLLFFIMQRRGKKIK